MDDSELLESLEWLFVMDAAWIPQGDQFFVIARPAPPRRERWISGGHSSRKLLRDGDSVTVTQRITMS